MEYIKTGTGSKYDVKHCGAMNNLLYITLTDISLQEVVNTFTNVEETSKITLYYDDDELVDSFIGFTNLSDISILVNDTRIVLIKPEQ